MWDRWDMEELLNQVSFVGDSVLVTHGKIPNFFFFFVRLFETMLVGVLQKLTLPKSECKEYRKHKTTQPKSR